MRQKVLLMGASGSGKTSMRSVIFSNSPASLTSRLGATIDVEQNHVRFLGDLILNLWDCGGQDSFMESYLNAQRSTIFSHVGVLIYVFDVEAREPAKDVETYRECLDALTKYSPQAAVFLLVHKMDLVRLNKRVVMEKKTRELQEQSGDTPITVFGTSIYDESLYKAWSRIVHTLIPNAAILTKHLTTFADACNATEVILFERTTFLVIATSHRPSTHPLHPHAQQPSVPLSAPASAPSTYTNDSGPSSASGASSAELTSSSHPEREGEDDPDNPHQMVPTRYERTSELIKAFKHACSRKKEEFHSLDMELEEFTAVLDELTKNTYIMVIVHDPTIETAAIKINIRLARQKFEELQADTVS